MAGTQLTTMGIDPGLTRMGVGVVAKEGSRLQMVACDTVTTKPADPIPHRLEQIFDGITEAIAT